MTKTHCIMVSIALATSLVLVACAEQGITRATEPKAPQFDLQESAEGQTAVPTVVVIVLQVARLGGEPVVPTQFHVLFEATFVQTGFTEGLDLIISGIGTPAQINRQIIAAARGVLEESMGSLPPGTQYVLFGGAQQ